VKKILKCVNKDPAAPIIIKEEPTTTKKKNIKRKVISTKRPILPKPTTSKKATPSRSKKAPAATPTTSRKVPPAATTSKKSRYSEATQRVWVLEKVVTVPRTLRERNAKRPRKQNFKSYRKVGKIGTIPSDED